MIDLADTMATLPGKTRNKLESLLRSRRATTPQRLDEAATLLSGGARAYPTLEAWQTAKEAAAKPAYAAVENMVVPITPKLESLMQLERAPWLDSFLQRELHLLGAAQRRASAADPSADHVVAEGRQLCESTLRGVARARIVFGRLAARIGVSASDGDERGDPDDAAGAVEAAG